MKRRRVVDGAARGDYHLERRGGKWLVVCVGGAVKGTFKTRTHAERYRDELLRLQRMANDR